MSAHGGAVAASPYLGSMCPVVMLISTLPQVANHRAEA